MPHRSWKLLSILFLFTLTTVPAHAQNGDSSSKNLQAVFDSAMIDFRDYRSSGGPVPTLSTSLAKVSCQMNTWANNVPMYVCYAQTPLAAGDSWFRSIVDSARRLQANWTFKVTANGDNRYAEGGPENCEVTPTEGPYIGQCPFHAQSIRQADGSANLYLWINSFSSPYLYHHPPSAKPVHRTGPDCDDFCQNFKKAFAARTNSFAELGATPNGEELSPEASVTFPGARKCLIKRTSRPQSGVSTQSESGVAFTCYWGESSATAADNRFRELVSRVHALLPTDWSTHQREESDAATGAAVTIWIATEPGATSDVRVYVSGLSVALHITTWPAAAP
jgi:hypothetical protein